MMDLFEEVSGKNLHWFFLRVINSEEHIDFEITKSTAGFDIEELGGSTSPYQIGYFKDGKLVKIEWHEGSLEKLTHWYPEIDFDVIKIDPYEVIPEVNRQNNTLKKNGLFKTVEPLEIKLMSVIHDPNKTSLNVFPLLGWNTHNKMMYGLWFNNVVTPKRNFNFSASPLYSSATEDVNGYFNINYSKAQNKPLNNFTAGVKGSRFSNQIQTKEYAYNRIVPYVKVDFRGPDKRSPITSRLTLKYTMLTFTPNFDEEASISSLLQDTGSAVGRRTYTEQGGDQFLKVEYLFKNAKTINPSQWKASIEMGTPSNVTHRMDTATSMLSATTTGDNFIKLNLEYKKRVTYKLKGKGLDIRVFGGTFLDESENSLYHYRMESGAGRWDYSYDEVLMGRGATEGVFSQQVIENDVFLKEPGTFANISQWTLAVNLKSDLPLKLPLGVYFDAFTFNGLQDLPNVEEGESFIYNGGIQIKVVPDFLEIYVPLLSSNMILEAQKLQGITDLNQRITFKLNFNFMQDKSMGDFFKLAQGG